MARFYDATRWMFLIDRRAAVSRLELAPGDSVLEVGAGTGHNLPALAGAVGHYGRVVGIDLSRDMLRRAGRRVSRNRLANVSLVCADATRSPFRRAFHAALFSYSLSMMPDQEDAVDTALGALLPDGRICVVDFGAFRGWGRWGVLPRRWLALNHVNIRGDEPAALARRLSRFVIAQRLRGYSLLICGKI